MSFREVDRPSSGAMLEYPAEGQPWNIAIPPAQLFKGELSFWHERRVQAIHEGDLATRHFAGEAVRGLRKAAKWRGAAELLMRKQVDTGGAIDGWLTSTMLAVSHSRMMREVTLQRNTANPQIASRPDMAFAVDLSEYDPPKSGLHARPEAMSYFLDIEPPERGQTRYYEGQALYLCATAPAHPTQDLTSQFQELYGVPFQVNDYVSIVPRIKTDFWTTGQ